MSLLSKITKGKIKKPFVLVVYGADGCGKSTFAAGSPNPIFLGTEQGTNHLDVARFPTPRHWDDVLQAVTELATLEHDYKTLVIDSLDWLEPMVHKEVCKRYGKKSIEQAAGGYGKGYIEAVDEFLTLKDKLNELRESRGMNVILIAHAQISNFNDPENQQEYQRFELKLHKKAGAVFREYADAVLFTSFQVYSSKDADSGKVRSVGSSQRIMYTERRPGFDAKNRLGLPFTLALSPLPSESWSTFAKAAEIGEPEAPEVILSRINSQLDLIDPTKLELIKATLEKAGNNVPNLLAIEQRINILANVEKKSEN